MDRKTEWHGTFQVDWRRTWREANERIVSKHFVFARIEISPEEKILKFLLILWKSNSAQINKNAIYWSARLSNTCRLLEGKES